MNYMYKCLKEAYKNIKKKELPIAAAIVQKNRIISIARNKKNIQHNALKHAEIMCISKACKKLKRWNLNDCELYVTLEPCEMCRYYIKESRIKKVHYLLPKLENKKLYQKTEFIEDNTDEKMKENYRKNLQDFFINKR